MKLNFIIAILFIFSSLGLCQDSNDKADKEKPASVPMKKIAAKEAAKESSETAPKAKVGIAAAPLKGLQWVKGSPVETFKKGSVYVVEFWATWCGPCRVSIPHLTEVQKKYKDKNVTIIGISNETSDKVKPFVEKMGDNMNYTIAIDTNGNADKAYMEAFGAQGIPTAFIVDQNSTIVWTGHPMADLDKVLEQVLERKFDMEKYAKEAAEKQARYEKIIKNGTAYFNTLKSGTKENARKYAEEVIKDADAPLLNDFAWQILMNVEKPKRDYSIALQAAAKANELTEGKDAMVLDTYALALFESAIWQIQESVKSQKSALELVGDNEQMKAGMKKAFDRYETLSKKITE